MRKTSLVTRHHSNQLLFPSLTAPCLRHIVFGILCSDCEHPRETVNLLTNEVMLLSLAYLTSVSLTSLQCRRHRSQYKQGGPVPGNYSQLIRQGDCVKAACTIETVLRRHNLGRLLTGRNVLPTKYRKPQKIKRHFSRKT